MAPRLSPLSETDWSDEVRAIVAGTAETGGGKILNIFATLARHPKQLKRWLVFGNHVLAKSTLPARERELLILRVGWQCGAVYEWGQHVRIGRTCGISDIEIAAIATGPSAPIWNAADALLLQAVDDLVTHHRISDYVFAQLAKTWTDKQMLDIVFTVGQYQLVSCALNTFGVERDDGVVDMPFPESPRG